MGAGACTLTNSASTTLNINDTTNYFLEDIQGIYEQLTDSLDADVPRKTPVALYLAQNLRKRPITLDISLRGTDPVTSLRALNAFLAVDILAEARLTLDYTTWENAIRRLIKGSIQEPTQIRRVGKTIVGVSLILDCQDPTFYDATEQEETGNFNGTTPVNISCENAGDWPAYLDITYEGPVSEPKLVDAYGYVMEIENDLSAGDTLRIITDPQDFTITYTPSGGSAVSWLGYRTGESQLVFVKPGTNNLTFTAASGNGAITAHWYNRYSTHG